MQAEHRLLTCQIESASVTGPQMKS